ncbi:MAG: Hint domain-containing protein [Sphingomonadales bacterium]|nr:Hint domain-containing protein [Sphingomonadales bacterium]
MEYGYPVDAIAFDRGRGAWVLEDGFDPETQLWSVETVEGETRVSDGLGRPVMTGQMTADIPLLLERPGGGTIRLDRIEIDGRLALYLPSEGLMPGHDYRAASLTSSGARAASPEEIAALPCLGTGTMIATDEGPQPIDWLRPGDRILTRDNGYQPLLWLGTHVMPRRSPAVTRPLILPADCFGPAQPERPIVASPGQGVLLAGHELELWFAESEMFASLRDVAPVATPLEGRQTLYSLLFATPEVILAEGLWVGSVQAEANVIAQLPDRVRAALAPRLAEGHREAARGWLEPWEVAMFARARSARKERFAA